MAIYGCIDCELSYCANCEPGEDSCAVCSTGPRCDDCAYEHEQEHKEATNEED